MPNYKYLVEDEIGEEEGVPQQFTFDFLKYEADIDYKTYFILMSLHDNMRVYNDNVMEGLNTD